MIEVDFSFVWRKLSLKPKAYVANLQYFQIFRFLSSCSTFFSLWFCLKGHLFGPKWLLKLQTLHWHPGLQKEKEKILKRCCIQLSLSSFHDSPWKFPTTLPVTSCWKFPATLPVTSHWAELGHIYSMTCKCDLEIYSYS